MSLPFRWPPRRWLATIVLAGAVAVLMLMTIAESFIFFPSRYPVGQWNPAGLPIEDAWFQTPDGIRLHGWYVPHPRPRAVVLFSHGNGGNLTHRLDALERLHAMGVTTLIFDYRGYGRSAGRPSVTGVLQDARAARRWLAEREGIDPQEIVLLGESLGGAVAVDLASRDGARGLILESTFTSLADVAAYHYPFLPVRLVMRSQLNSLEKIANYHGPVLMCHGQADTIVPLSLGEKLYSAANPPKRLVKLQGHDHNDPLPQIWYDALNTFLAELDHDSQ